MAEAYDDQNVFAKILRGELPCEKLYEDEHTVAIMDIMPRAEGHCLVIPKAPARNIFDVDYFEAGAFNSTARPGEPFTVLGSLSVTF